MNNQQREQQALSQPNRELEILEEQLRESAAAEDFFNLASGKLWTKIATTEITRITRDVTSDKYLNDHVGYVEQVTLLLAYKTILRKMQVAASPVRKGKILEKMSDDTDNTENT